MGEEPGKTEIYVEDVGPEKGKKKERPAAATSPKADRAPLSAEVVPRTGGTGSIEVTDRKDMKKKGLPKDAGAMVNLVLDVMEKNKEKNKDSVAYNAVRGALFLYSKYFGFAMTPGSFSMYIDSAFYNENFDKEQMEKLWVNTYKKQYAYLSKKYKTAKDEDEKSKILKDMKALEERLYEFDHNENEKKDDYIKRMRAEVDSKVLEYEQNDEVALETAELDKFEGIDDADPYISTYYVSKKLGVLNPNASDSQVEKEYDPHRLHANLLHSEYKDTYQETTKNLYDFETSESEFKGRFSAGTLPAGTVVFFQRVGLANVSSSNQSKQISGIVGMDGKIRYQTKNGLEVFDGFDPINNDMMELLGEFEDKGTVDLNKKTKGIIERSKTASIKRFMGAFIPNIEKGDKTQEEPKEEDKKDAPKEEISGAEALNKAESETEAASAAEASTEAADPAEEPKTEAAPATEAKAEPEPEAKEETKKEEDKKS
jgi:hypothetical protein